MLCTRFMLASKAASDGRLEASAWLSKGAYSKAGLLRVQSWLETSSLEPDTSRGMGTSGL